MLLMGLFCMRISHSWTEFLTYESNDRKLSCRLISCIIFAMPDRLPAVSVIEWKNVLKIYPGKRTCR